MNLPKPFPRSKATEAYQRKSDSLDAVSQFFEHHTCAARIRAARAWLGWSQQDLANLAGVSAATIKRIERLKYGQFRGDLGCMMQILATFEDNGAMFIDADPNGDLWGGVLFRQVGFDTICRQQRRIERKPSSTRRSARASRDATDTSKNRGFP